MHSATILLNPISSYPKKLHFLAPKLQDFQPRLDLHAQPIKRMAFLGGLALKIGASGSAGASGGDGGTGFQTLTEYMGKGGEDVGDELVLLYSHLEYACKKIAALVASPFNSSLAKNFSAEVGSAERDKPKPLDLVAVRFLLS